MKRYGVFKDGVLYLDRDTAEKCVAELLVKGWLDPPELYGVTYVRGVNVRELTDAEIAELEKRREYATILAGKV